MADAPFTYRTWLFWLVFAVWLSTAIPMALFSLFMFELPLWPSFNAEGVAIWATFAAWFYITPVVLALIGRRGRTSACKTERL